ncbi:hypothetical protein HPP92_021364 [Vanilla planifolia]|uniref:Homeobox domain-containing protein n=1 Tax=Vanilla planifolia TaxID=51239 RepID=A0A835Q434_VANPL|nr:hypothetical protein HPP92_021364 [Vanilla planifolia]
MKEFSKRQEEKGIWLFGDEAGEKQQECAKFLVQTQHLLGDHHLFEGNRYPSNSTNKKKKRSQLNKIYHRHTDEQIQQMEEVFKECQHPDEMTRRELSRRVALEPVQIKFWFQNKRTQIKNAQERKENQRLRAANELLLLRITSTKKPSKALPASNVPPPSPIPQT